MEAPDEHPAIVSRLRDLGARSRQLASEVGRRYFAHVAPLERTVWQ